MNSTVVPDIMAGLTDVEEETVERILSETLNMEKNRGAKSRIPNPLNTARLQAMADTARIEGYPKFASFLQKLEENIRLNQVSEDGERVKEVIRALSESIRESRRDNQTSNPPLD
jgi:hypothetical protein